MKIGIVGLGLIGGTIAQALKKEHQISAYDISEAALKYGVDKGIIDKSYNNLLNFLIDNEVFFICLYPNDIVKFIFENKDFIPTNSLVIEISGIKQYMISEISKFGKLNFDLVFTHPIAGSEKTGVYNSNANIFAKANFVITPISSNKAENLLITENLAKKMGFSSITYVTPEEHDAIIAYTSQLTHVLSLSLVNAVSGCFDTQRFIGDSYRDLTRISMINDKLWPELFLYNKEALLGEIDSFEKELSKIKHFLKMNDRHSLADLMQKSTSTRLAMEKGKKDEN